MGLQGEVPASFCLERVGVGGHRQRMTRWIVTLLVVPTMAMGATEPAPAKGKPAPAKTEPAPSKAVPAAPKADPAPAKADANAKAEPAPEKDESAVETKVPPVSAMIPAAVAAVPEPAIRDFQGGLTMAITAFNPETQAHVVLGLNYLHGGWEFEAARHFAAAAKLEPDCLMAHWGMALALFAPNPETSGQRDAAVDRMLALVDAGKGNELERVYAYAMIKYFKDGPGAAADAFRKLNERYPNDIQAAMFNALFSRGGYNELGAATPDQERSEKIIEDLIKRFPDSTLLIHTYLKIHAEAPDLQSALPLARKLCQLAPGYAPYFQMLGHYEWRTGNHAQAVSAFSHACSLYETWMKASQVSVMDCPGWVASECYRCVALASKGDYETALAAATALAARKVPVERSASSGGRLLLWEAKTLPARLLMARGGKGDISKALASLPAVQEIANYEKTSLARWYVDGLRLDLDGLRLIEEQKYEEATNVSEALSHHGEGMERVQRAASVIGERSLLFRNFRALEVLASELRGRLAMAGPKATQMAADTWFRSAADRQRRATDELPPAVLTPMAVRQADYQLLVNKPGEAVESYHEALKAFPNDLGALKGLAKAADKAGMKEDAATTRKKIEELTAQ